MFIDLLKELVAFDSKEMVIEINRVHIETYPSHHLDVMQGLSMCILMNQPNHFGYGIKGYRLEYPY